MAVQETVTNAIASLLGSRTGVIAGFVAVAAFWFGLDFLSNAFDVHLPLRQLLAGRGLNVVSLHVRVMYAVAGSYFAARFLTNAPHAANG
jgi:hypothetical protein